jgi:hypothetical protein
MPVPADFPVSLPSWIIYSFREHTSLPQLPLGHAARLMIILTILQFSNSTPLVNNATLVQIYATPHQHLLHHYRPLPTPFHLLGADGIHSIVHYGIFALLQNPFTTPLLLLIA